MAPLAVALAASVLVGGEPGSGTFVEALTAVETALERGEVAVAERELDVALTTLEENPRLAYARASAAALRGALEEAERWLQRAVAWGFDDVALAGWDPRLAALRESGRLAAVLEGMPADERRAPRIELVAGWGTERPRLDRALGRLELGPGARRCVLDLATGALVTVRHGGPRYWQHETTTPDGSASVARSWRGATVQVEETGELLWAVEGTWIAGASYVDPRTVALRWRDGGVELRRGDDGELLQTLPNLGARCTRLRAFGDDEVLVATEGGTLWRADLSRARATGVVTGVRQPGFGGVSTVSGLAALDGWAAGDCAVVDLRGGRVASRVDADRLWGLDAPGERLLASEGERLRVVRARTGAVELELDVDALQRARWGRDGSWFATVGAAGVGVWDAASARLRLAIESPAAAQVAFDPRRDRVVVTVGNATAQVRSLVDGALVHTLDHASEMEFFFEGRDRLTGVAFDSAGERIVTASGTWLSLSCWEAETGRCLWHWDAGGGVGLPADVRFVRGGGLVHVAGWWELYLDAATGEPAELPAGAEGGVLSGARGERFVGLGTSGLTVHDPRTWELRCSITPCRTDEPGGGYVACSPQGYVAGSPQALREAQVPVDGVPWPVDSFAPALFDPLRVRAAAAGVELRRPRLPRPPRLLSVSPSARVLQGSAPPVEVVALGGHGPKRLELVVDGERVTAPALAVTHRGDVSRLRFRAGPAVVPDGATLELRAVDARGFASRIHRLSVER